MALLQALCMDEILLDKKLHPFTLVIVTTDLAVIVLNSSKYLHTYSLAIGRNAKMGVFHINYLK